MIPEADSPSPDDCYSGSSDAEFSAFLEQTLKKDELKKQTEEKEKIQEDIQGEAGTEVLADQQRNSTETATATIGVVAKETGDEVDDITCPHPIVLKNLCSHCGEVVEESGSRVAFNYIYKDLMVEPSEADKLGKGYTKHFLKNKKLILVLDLDHTLINSVYLDDLIEEEEYLLDQLQIPKEEDLFQLEEYSMLTKLRPFVRTFLEEANNMFEMYIYTMGERGYADEIAKLLDPSGVYFPLRVICRSDSTTRNQKGLDIVIGPENLVIVLDDSKQVWKKHKENIIEMQPYNYFAYSVAGSKTKSLTQSNIDESESDGILASILTVLRVAHERFYDPEVGIDFGMRDVRQILATIKMEILKGCHILVTEEQPKFEAISKLAEGMGAVCYFDEDDSVTHVVATVSTTMMAEWARDNNKLLVSPQWIEKAHYLWKRQEEDNFPVL